MSDPSFTQIIDLLAMGGKYGSLVRMLGDRPLVRDIYAEMTKDHTDLLRCIEPLLCAHQALIECFSGGGKLLTCGNGGSHADALHMAGELCKGFELPRRLGDKKLEQLSELIGDRHAAAKLQHGLPVIALGNNASITTATINDTGDGRLCMAQECLALARQGDAFLGISTSGEAENVRFAAAVARSQGAVVISLTGADGGRLAPFADIAIKAPGARTASIQEQHVILYHTLCRAIEAHIFTEK